MRKLTLFVIAASVIFPIRASAQDSKPGADQIIESGHWRLHKFQQPIGDENYAIRKEGADRVLTTKFKFVDRGMPVILNTTLRTADDLTPRSFKTKGNVSRFSTIDVDLTIGGTHANIRENKSTRIADVADRFFTITGYAPVAIQQELARYVAAHKVTGALPTLPGGGEVTLESRGKDSVPMGNRQVDLERFVVTGLIWGRQTFWLDAEKRLVALVSIDAEFDHFEAVIDELEPSLGFFVKRAAEDAMAGLAAMPATRVAAPAGPLAITNCRLIDGTGAPPVSPATVLVDKGRITAAGPSSKVTAPAGATMIDAGGKTVLPGLWDMHAHFEQVEWGPIYLAAGVTIARDCGNEFDFITTVRDVIARKEGVGPRLLLAGIVDGDSRTALGIVRANDAEGARAVVAKYKAAGFQQIKIYSSVKKDVVAAICNAAHEAGMTVTGHIPNGMTAMDGIEAGMDMISHIQYVTDVTAPPKKTAAESAPAGTDTGPEESPLLAAIKKHHTVIDPTLVVFEWFMHPAETPFSTYEPGVEKVARELYPNLTNAGSTPDVAPRMQKAIERFIATVTALHAAGVTIVAGTDQVVPGHSLYRELELYVKAGFTPMEAIQSATIVPARAMRLDSESGTVESGKIADLIIVDGDPLASISDIRKVRTVVAAGRVFECAPLWQSVGFKP